MARFGALLAVAAAGLTLATWAFATPALPVGWTHAIVNLVSPKGVPYTAVYDRGVVTAVSPTSLTLRETGGTIWVINIAPTAAITIAGQPGTLAQVQPKDIALTLSINGAAASTVAVLVPASAATTTTTTTTVTTVTPATTTTKTTTTPKVKLAKPSKPKPKVIRPRAPGSLTTSTGATVTTATTATSTSAIR
jgi:hypothetical protein